MDIFHLIFTATAVGILVFSADDLLIDLEYWLRMAKRYLRRRERSPLTLEKLNAVPEQKLALMIPCWQESEVVAEMLSHMLATLEYKNYEVFVGVYPNDSATRDALSPLLQKNPHIHEVVGPLPGPTTKAQNLNSIYAGIRSRERKTGERYDIFVMHDAEDVIHPLSFKLYNYLLPRKDMIQIPVFPLATRRSWVTHWTYADEFAENHTKDMIAREWLGGFVPSAGVGTAFSKRAMDTLWDATEGALFNTHTLTEDYSFSLLLRRHHLTGIFVHQSVERIEMRPRWYLFGRVVPRRTKEWIATRALFPVNYKNAIRQKSRWILGIAFQEWKSTGWEGDQKTKYSLYRDRKAPIGHILIISAYFFLGWWLVWRGSVALWGEPAVPPLKPLAPWLLVAVTVTMVHRLIERAIAVMRIYGWEAALTSVPRVIILNVINAHAFVKGFSQFWRSERKKQPILWAKTANHFPTNEQLMMFRRRLGEILVENSVIEQTQLQHALERQQAEGGRLGRILLDEGVISENELLQTMGQLFSMDVVAPKKWEKAKDEWKKLPRGLLTILAERRAVPVVVSERVCTLAINDPTDSVNLENVKKTLSGRDVQFVLESEEALSRQLNELKET